MTPSLKPVRVSWGVPSMPESDAIRASATDRILALAICFLMLLMTRGCGAQAVGPLAYVPDGPCCEYKRSDFVGMFHPPKPKCQHISWDVNRRGYPASVHGV